MKHGPLVWIGISILWPISEKEASLSTSLTAIPEMSCMTSRK